VSDIIPKLSISQLAEDLNLSIQGVHKKLKSLDIPYYKMGNKAYVTYKESRKLLDFKFKTFIINSHIVKGGTGKTTAVQNIGACINSYGAKVLFIDNDPQANLSDAFRVDPEKSPVLIDCIKSNYEIEECIHNVCDGIDILPSRIENVVIDGEMQTKKLPIDKIFSSLIGDYIKKNKYDFVFIDCPPTMGHIVTAATIFSDLILIPLNPNKFSTKGLSILKGEAKNLKKFYQHTLKYKVFLNKFSGNTILSDKAINTVMSDEYKNNNALSTAIRRAQEIENITDAGLTLFSHLKQSEAREDFRQLTKELLKLQF